VPIFLITFSAEVPPEEGSPERVKAERYRTQDASFVFYIDDTIVESLPINKVSAIEEDVTD
jgi:hypothetical protein